jgi:hypothetical protein
MNSSESKDKPTLYEKICDVLRKEWDPIGVGESPGAFHEYDGYAQSLLEMLRQRATQAKIFAYLWWAETENMGLDGERKKTEQIAERLANLRL